MTKEAAASTALELVKKHFNKTLEAKGIVLTGAQLRSFAREKKILKDLRSGDVEKYLSAHPSVAHHGRADRVSKFQTVGVPRSGMYHIDYGEFHKNWSWHNSGATGFLVAVENFTNRLFVLPTKGKGTKEWLNAIAKFVELTREVRVIYTDRDSVATSPKFRTEIVDKYGIEWHFLKKGNKSYLAERYIGFVKTKLSQALEQEEGGGGKKWETYISDLCSEYNKQKVEGTSYRRQAISKSNFDHFMGQLLDVKDPALLYNGFAAGPFERKSWNRAIFKFDLGDKVLVARAANWKFPTEKLGSFGKATVRGSFGTAPYTVTGRQLRSDKSRKNLVAVYSLEEFGPNLHFYTKELRAAPSSSSPLSKT